MQDLLILGGGVAGLTAAIYATRARLSATLLEAAMPGGQALETAQVENYPGVPDTDGVTLTMTMMKQAKDLGADIRTAAVTGLSPAQGGYTVTTNRGKFTARAVIVATGASHRTLDIPGEERLRGHGVSYCATCDGRFFKGQTVAVIGGGNTAAEEALYLARLCGTVVLVHRREELRASRVLQERLEAAENIRICRSARPLSIEGDERVSGLRLATPAGEETLSVNGVFVAVGLRPNSDPFPALPKDENGFLLADEDGVTALPGVFAAGDVRAKRCRQLITAAGDGAAAAMAAERYLAGE